MCPILHSTICHIRNSTFGFVRILKIICLCVCVCVIFCICECAYECHVCAGVH